MIGRAAVLDDCLRVNHVASLSSDWLKHLRLGSDWSKERELGDN